MVTQVAFANSALQRDPSAMGFGQPFDDGKPKSSPFAEWEMS